MTKTETEAAGKPRTRSIVQYLVVIALLTLLPSFVFAGVLLQRNHAAQEAVLETLVLATSRSLVQAVEREISANETTLRVLATSPSFYEGDFKGFYDRTVMALAGTGANLFVIDPDFTTLLSTRSPFGPSGSKTADPESAEKAFSTGQTVVTDLVFGAVSKEWVYNILMPIDLGPFGRKIVALNQRADNFSNTLLANKFPDGWSTALVDNDDLIIAASGDVGQTGELFEPFDVSELPLTTGWQRIDTPAGGMRVVVQRSALTGWRMVTWAPEGVIARPLLEAVTSLVVGGVLLGALVSVGLLWVSRTIGSSVRGLARDARALGRGEQVVARAYPVAEIAEVNEALAVASRQRLAAEREVHFLMREVAHRSKNQMTVISAMAKQTARGADDVASYVQGFEKRIMGLARSTDLLLAHGRAGVLLRELVEHQLEPFCPEDPARKSISGPVQRLNTQSAQTLGMALHELSTNAVKYGAFGGDKGRLVVDWTIADDKLNLVWRETGALVPPTGDRVGFGTTVLKSMVGRSLRAEVERICHDDGIEWRFSIPLTSIDPDLAPPPVEPEDSE